MYLVKGFQVSFRGSFKTLEAAIEYAEKFCVDKGRNTSPEYIQYITLRETLFDRKEKDSPYGRIAVVGVEYFDK
ncbi:hypothetical protein BGX21_004363 [Mortierella sp. AD011]|nr:hypothetical protein BGX21_004363 [Mortierella sp. AD011]